MFSVQLQDWRVQKTSLNKKKKNYANLPKKVHEFDSSQFAFSFFEDPDKQLITAFNKNLMTDKAKTKIKSVKNKISSR